MKKVWRTIKLRKIEQKFADDVNVFIICFNDDTWKSCMSKDELRSQLEKEHIKGIRYIFEMKDRIVIDRNVLINTEEVEKC